MSVWTNLLQSALPAILSLAQTLADSQVKGEELTKDFKQALYLAYCAIQIYGKNLVLSTANPYDDMALEELAKFAKDTLKEAGIDVPEIPLELEPEKKVAKSKAK